ncbi:Rdx family-domain-containing protein [Aspergillus varians]
MTDPTAPLKANPPPTSTTTTQSQSDSQSESHSNPYANPRITIQYCTQCKWMLRAAYFAQELLSTFSTDIGEVALVPRTGGVFTVTIFPGTAATTVAGTAEPGTGTVLWDRKRDGGFPEVKMLKSRVRNVIDPSRDLGHTDRALKKGAAAADSTVSVSGSGSTSTSTPTFNQDKAIEATSVTSEVAKSGVEACEDCK